MTEQNASAAAGMFRWYELRTSDPTGAEAFYCAVVGWTASHQDGPAGRYTVLETPKGGVAGIGALAQGEAAPGWVGYVAVDDVDAAVAEVTTGGGRVIRPPADVPGILRRAEVADPGGAPFIVYKGVSAGAPPLGQADEVGFVGWRELMAGDGESALEFYTRMFGWRQTDAINMGPMGPYRIWTDGRGHDVGGMMTKPPGGAPAHWNLYLQVDSIEAATGRLEAAGGAVTVGPMQVPRGNWIVQGTDPQGADFCLVSKRQ
jgi:predicted enzyme related to lactoylglutathione lyase